MKTIHPVTLTVLVCLSLVQPSAKANLVLTNDPAFGANSLTLDTSTGLGWLNLSVSAGLSYQQVMADTQSGGNFSGFRLATAQEVLDLYASAGIPGTGYYSLSTPAIPSLFALVGTSGTINGHPGVLALSSTSVFPGTYCAPAIYVTGINGVEEYWVNGGGFESGGTAYGPTFSYPDVGSWLVKDVPEPADTSFCVLVAAVWFGFTFLQRQLRRRPTSCRSGPPLNLWMLMVLQRVVRFRSNSPVGVALGRPSRFSRCVNSRGIV